jgi:small redox-active disulfide protein 2
MKTMSRWSDEMAEKDITRISIGDFSVSIIGIRLLMEEMAKEYTGRADEEVRKTMLERLSKDNYIPARAMDDYGRAFVREFRKFLGQPYEEATSAGLDIKVLGPGCPGCDRLEQVLMELVAELRLVAGIEHVQDLKEIARYRVMATPALVINGKVVSKGVVPPKEQIKKWLAEAAPGGADA